jgi:hypothetical protein
VTGRVASVLPSLPLSRLRDGFLLGLLPFSVSVPRDANKDPQMLRRCLSASSGPAPVWNVYATGEGYLGCLGMATHENIAVPTLIPSLAQSPAVSVAAGWFALIFPGISVAFSDAIVCVCLVCRGHSAVVTADGQPLVFGRPHDFGNTLRLINLNRGFPWVANAFNKFAQSVWKVDHSPSLGFAVPDSERIVAATCSPGPLTAFRCGVESCARVCMCLFVGLVVCGLSVGQRVLCWRERLRAVRHAQGQTHSVRPSTGARPLW